MDRWYIRNESISNKLAGNRVQDYSEHRIYGVSARGEWISAILILICTILVFVVIFYTYYHIYGVSILKGLSPVGGMSFILGNVMLGFIMAMLVYRNPYTGYWTWEITQDYIKINFNDKEWKYRINEVDKVVIHKTEIMGILKLKSKDKVISIKTSSSRPSKSIFKFELEFYPMFEFEGLIDEMSSVFDTDRYQKIEWRHPIVNSTFKRTYLKNKEL